MYKNKRYDGYELKHSDFKPKYIGKEMVNGKWRYYYDKPLEDSDTKSTSKSTTKSTTKSTNKKSTSKYDKIVKEIISGKWGNGKSRRDKLSKAGYDFATIQNEVNKKLGNSYRHSTKTKKAVSKVVDNSKKKTVKSVASKSKKGEEIANKILK